MSVSIVWFRQDLRLADHPALQAALQRGGAIVPVYIDSPAEDGRWPDGAAARWWLRATLQALDADLPRLGSRLIFARGPALPTLRRLCAECGADAVFWSRRYEPAAMERDRAVKSALRADGLLAESRHGALLLEPWEIANQSGKPFLVFTPYWKQVLKQLQPAAPVPAPTRLPPPANWPTSATLDTLFPLPAPPWHRTMESLWQPGESGAQQRLQRFIADALPGYRDLRDRPAVAGTSTLSPYLHVGAISPRQIWQAIGAAESAGGSSEAEWRDGKFLAELVWREFAHHLLFHHPHLPDEPLRAEFAHFPWREDDAALQAWQQGRTGIPLVDAGMRELWATGWMHNRVRMVVASFLVKNLRLHWLHGARWFWDTLIDADLANNTQGWQWTAGCGADAAPYFRIFNPHSQAERFDPDGEYVRRWAPEAGTSAYPPPIVDLAASRVEALAAFQTLRAQRA
jgi:deoxyribodipyrimidine photo-lyase